MLSDFAALGRIGQQVNLCRLTVPQHLLLKDIRKIKHVGCQHAQFFVPQEMVSGSGSSSLPQGNTYSADQGWIAGRQKSIQLFNVYGQLTPLVKEINKSYYN